ncbi:hypothetical protein [Streptococcus merionis]|uniref:hypothetical protein n=1 Tax=Streptococcus merionis TaxID=400065 RepID=UPI0035158C73
MKPLSQDQFYQVMNIIQKRLSIHNESLYYEYGYSSKLEGKLEVLKDNIKRDLQQFTDLDD